MRLAILPGGKAACACLAAVSMDLMSDFGEYWRLFYRIPEQAVPG